MEIKATDDKGDVGTAAAQAHDLIDTGINAMIGPVNSNQAAAVIPIVAARGLPQLITATSATLLGLGQGNVLRLLANDDQQGRAIASFATETLRAQRIAIVVEKSDYGRGLDASVVAGLARKHLVAVASAEVDDKTPLPPQTIDRFSARPRSTPSCSSHASRSSSSCWTHWRQARLERRRLSSAGNVIRNKSVAHRGPTVRAPYATATAIDAKEFPEGKVFLDNFQKRFGADPVWGAQYAYDAVYALADAARQARSLQASDLVDTLKHIEPGTKVNQQMRFAVSGEQVYPSIGVYKVDHGSWAMQMMSATW